jgi:type II secretory pathway component PulC
MLAWLLLAALAAPPPDMTVLGVVIHQAPARSTALLRSADRTRVVSVGDTAFGGQVVSVSASGVVLEFASGRVLVPLAMAPRATPSPSPSPATQSPARDTAEAVEDPATPHRLMARAEVERRLGAEIPRILAETALAPVVEDGHVTGLAVTRVPEGTVLSDAGLRSGDVIKQINDTVIDGMGTLIGLWPRLQGATELRAVVQRGGRSVVLSVTLR